MNWHCRNAPASSRSPAPAVGWVHALPSWRRAFGDVAPAPLALDGGGMRGHTASLSPRRAFGSL